MSRSMARSPRGTGQRHLVFDALAASGVDDVSEYRAVVLVHLDAECARAVRGECVEQITEPTPTPFCIWRRRWELMSVVRDVHRATLIDADAGDWKVDGGIG